MRSVIVVILFLILTGITIFPFNALHHHQEDEHVHAQQCNDTQHHCALDNRFCEGLSDHDCAHDAHISKPVPHCFSCHFHFLTTIIHADAASQIIACANVIQYNSCLSVLFQVPAAAPGNKGPPLMI